MNELSQLDELIESDVLDALGERISEDTQKEEEIKIESFDEVTDDSVPIIEEINTTLNSNDLASILGQLLNNKTIEITIKIKD